MSSSSSAIIVACGVQLKCRLGIVIMPSINERGRQVAAMGEFGRANALVTPA